MSGLQLKVTDAGRAALVNAANTGTLPVVVSEVGITATAFTADGLTAALPGELKRISTIAGAAVADDTIHVTVSDDTADAYSMRGFALYLADGTLFASYGQAAVLLEKSTQATLLMANDIRFVDITATDIAFGDASFSNPPATTSVLGVVELATNDETNTGTDSQRVVVPSALKYALDQRFGAGAPSAFVKSLLNLATAALLRAAIGLGNASVRNEGAGNGLDADKLDGQEGAYYMPLAQRGAANGVAPLGSDGKVAQSYLPATAITDVFVVATQAAQLALTAQEGDVAVRSDQRISYIHNGGTAGTMADWQELLTPTDVVSSVAGKTGAVTLATADVAGLDAALAARAPLASPAFTGNPTAPTPATADNDTSLATTAFVKAALAAALADYLPKNNPTFTGTMTGPAFNKAP